MDFASMSPRSSTEGGDASPRGPHADAFAWATRAERALRSSIPGRLLLVVFAVASPVDLALDVRMGAALVALDVPRVLPALLICFLYLGLRLQLLLFVATSGAAPAPTATGSFFFFFSSRDRRP